VGSRCSDLRFPLDVQVPHLNYTNSADTVCTIEACLECADGGSTFMHRPAHALIAKCADVVLRDPPIDRTALPTHHGSQVARTAAVIQHSTSADPDVAIAKRPTALVRRRSFPRISAACRESGRTSINSRATNSNVSPRQIFSHLRRTAGLIPCAICAHGARSAPGARVGCARCRFPTATTRPRVWINRTGN
jgi:hypothetical protein